MRKVLRDKHEVCHFWANQVQQEGRAGNVYFDGPTIYSYGPHFPMATILQGVAVFTTRTYSSSTAQHLYVARNAANHLRRLFVTHPTLPAINQVRGTEEDIAALLAKAEKARSRRGEYVAKAASTARDFNAFAELRGESVRVSTDFIDSPDINAYLVKAASDRRERAEAERRQIDADLIEQRAAWRTGRGVSVSGSIMLRLSGDEVQTSQGANIRRDDATRLWPLIQRARACGDAQGYEVGAELGNYRLTKIRRDGSIVVGCHDIPYAEIEGIARELGLTRMVLA